MNRICVIGAGVSGLSTAIELQQREYRVTIFTESEGDDTTSSAAAAFWYPFWTGDEPDHSWYRPEWAWNTLLALEAFLAIPDAGVTSVELVEYFDERMSETDVKKVVSTMWWQVFRRVRFELLGPGDVSGIYYARNERLGFRGGLRFNTMVVNMAYYLPYLRSRFLANGGEVMSRRVERHELHDLCLEFDYVVNCTGLGSRELINDSHMKSIEGVVVKVSPHSEIKGVTLLHTGPLFSKLPLYIVARGGPRPDVILGGTIEDWTDVPRHFQWSSVPVHEIRIHNIANVIVDRCASINPAVRNATKLGIGVGYRPVRDPNVRLEPGAEIPGRLVHNYGHGGAGITLSWGCAQEVAAWLKRLSAG